MTLPQPSKVVVDNPETFNHCYAEVNQHRYHYVDQGPREATLIVLVHGFPESWFSWKYQIQHLSENLNFRVIAVDKPGYGETNVGKELSGYTIKSTCKDIHDLVKYTIGRDEAIYIGHDWGAQTVWMMGLYYPDAVIGLVGMSVPFLPPKKEYVDVQSISKHFPFLGYQAALADGDIEEFNSNIQEFLQCFWSKSDDPIEKSVLYTPIGSSIIKHIRESKPKTKDFPTKKFMDYLVSQFKIQGCEGPSNWYRTRELNHKDALIFPLDVKIKHPSLLIMETQGLSSFVKSYSEDHFIDISTKTVNSSHWLHMTDYKEVNQLVTDWLKFKRFFPTSHKNML